MDGWLDLEAIRDILGLDSEALKKRIQRGKFTKIRQQKVTGKGARGGQIWQVHITDPAISKEHQDAWFLAQVKVDEHLPAVKEETLPAVIEEPELPAVSNLKSWQSETMDARLAFIRLIERASSSSIGVTKAILTLVEKAADGALPPEVQQLVPIANKKSGKSGERTLSRRSLMRWWSDYKKNGGNYAALAPKKLENHDLPPWAADFLASYQKPSKPTVQGALEDMAKFMPASELPSYDQARRFLKKMGKVELEKGRRNGQDLRAIKPYVIRDTSDMVPAEIYISDGLTFRAWGIAHPKHGKPFSPEICDVKDVATRRIVGWSVGLAESGQVMAAALRNSVETAIPAGWYHDRGPGYENELLTKNVTGILDRCGITNMRSIALQSQSRGMIEKLRQDLWHKAAKDFASYKGRDMDRIAAKQAYKIIKKDIKEKGISDLVMPWTEFLVWVQETIDTYNNRPHRALPKIRDGVTGRMRHMTPNEAWQKAVDEGWTPMQLAEAELADLFLPEKLCKVTRGMVTLFGNSYASGSLAELHGEFVRVGYDIHDPRAVRIRNVDGQFICFAKFEANKRRFVPKSVSQQMIDKRAAAAKKRLDEKYDLIEQERRGTLEVEKPVVVVRELPPDVIDFEQKQKEKEEERQKVIEGRRFFKDCHELADDIMQRQKAGEAVGEYEARWIADYQLSAQGPRRVGLYLADPECAGRFKIQAAQ